MIRTDTWLRAHADELGIRPDCINPASVDVCLGEKIVEYRSGVLAHLLSRWSIHRSGHEPTTDPDKHGASAATFDNLGREYRLVGRVDHVLAPGQAFTFRPGRFYLAHTEERTTLPEDHCAQLILKSSSGRKGLDHAHSGWGDPAFRGQWTFEFVAHRAVSFVRGQRIAQLVFMQCDERPIKTYAETGRYQGQTGVQEAKPE